MRRFIITICLSFAWGAIARTPVGSHARTLTNSRTGAPPGIVDLRTDATTPTKAVTASNGPFRTKTPRVLGSTIQRSQYNFSTSVPAGSGIVLRTARTPASSASTQAGWGGFDPSLFSTPSFVPPAITSGAGATQSGEDFAKAIAALVQSESDNSLPLSLLDQARNNLGNPLEQSGLGSGNSGKGGGSGGGGPGSGGGNKNHNKQLQDELDRLRNERAFKDRLTDDAIRRLQDEINELNNRENENFGPGGGANITPGPNGFVPEKKNHDWSRAGNSSFDISKLPDGTSSGSAGDLIAANTNGNPGFQYQTDLGGGARAGCQGSLVYADKGYCVMATAAHCLDDSIYNSGSFSTDNSLGGYTAPVTFRTADFGVVQAVAYMNHEYAVDNWQDTGAVVFRCPEDTAKKLTVLKINSNVSGGLSVQYGKVMGGKEGYYSGTTLEKDSYSVPNHRPYRETQISVNQHGTSIQQGDSGGPLVIGDQLVGVLSNKDAQHSNYAAKTSMYFLERIIGQVQTQADGEAKAKASQLAQEPKRESSPKPDA